mgnify:CR=1 FL=1
MSHSLVMVVDQRPKFFLEPLKKSGKKKKYIHYNYNNETIQTISKLKEKYGCDVGYSGHERGLIVSLAAVALGATSIERHITLDRSMWGTDQSGSLEFEGLKRLIRDTGLMMVFILMILGTHACHKRFSED